MCYTYRNVLLALIKMWMVLMKVFALLALSNFFPNEQISYMYEVVFVLMLLKMLDSLYLTICLHWAINSHKCEISGGVRQPFCPYECISDKYRMPNCYTPLEELVYTFGGPWSFALLLSCILVLLALLLSTLRIKLVGSSSSYGENSMENHSHHHFPYLLSLSEVQYS